MKTFFKRTAILALGLLLVGQGCLPGGGNSNQGVSAVELDIWRVLDSSDSFDDIIGSYQQSHPFVRINYRKLRLEEYEEELVRALAEGRGPDIFSIHNTWIGEYESLIAPMPATVTIVEPVASQGLQRKVTYEQVEKRLPSLQNVKETYVEQVWRDVGNEEGAIVGLPLAMDSLALFYNRDLLDASGIPAPPTTWSQLQEQVIELTSFDSSGNIEQSGVALGRSDNVERGVDVLQLLMLQNGTEFVDDRNRVLINTIPSALQEVRDVAPALTATEVYTDFANPIKETYSWNESFSSSFDAFVNGRTAFFFGYNYHIPFIEASAPKLNYAVVKAPQIEGAREINLASYWVETVASASKDQAYAWDFIAFASSEEQAERYLKATGKPTAHRSLLPDQMDNPEVGVFASQNLTARHWYKGNNVTTMENALKDLINAILQNPEDPRPALNTVARQISQTLGD